MKCIKKIRRSCRNVQQKTGCLNHDDHLSWWSDLSFVRSTMRIFFLFFETRVISNNSDERLPCDERRTVHGEERHRSQQKIEREEREKLITLDSNSWLNNSGLLEISEIWNLAFFCLTKIKDFCCRKLLIDDFEANSVVASILNTTTGTRSRSSYW